MPSCCLGHASLLASVSPEGALASFGRGRVHNRQMAKDGLDCDDCRMSTFGEFYMVHDRLWDQYGSEGMLCVGCLESRMGRQLVTEDFTAANFDPRQLNTSKYSKSERLVSRLTSNGEWRAAPA